MAAVVILEDTETETVSLEDLIQFSDVEEHVERAERFFGEGRTQIITDKLKAQAKASWTGLFLSRAGFPLLDDATIRIIERIHHGSFFAGAVKALVGASPTTETQEVANVGSH